MISKQSFFSSTGLIIFVLLTSLVAIDNSQLSNLFRKTDFQVGTATDLTIVQMYPDGLQRYTATILSATQFNNHNIAFKTLHIHTFPQDNSPPWNISADTGRISDNNSRIDLWNNVKAARPAKGNYQPLLFTTDHITLYPNKHYATTTSRVNLTEPGTKNMITGVGMKAYSKPKEVIHLLSDVQSTYEPKNYQPDTITHQHQSAKP